MDKLKKLLKKKTLYEDIDLQGHMVERPQTGVLFVFLIPIINIIFFVMYLVIRKKEELYEEINAETPFSAEVKMKKKIDDRKDLIIGSIMIFLFIVVEIFLLFGLRSIISGTLKMEDLSNQTLYALILVTGMFILGIFKFIPDVAFSFFEDTKELYRRLSLNYRKTKPSKSIMRK